MILDTKALSAVADVSLELRGLSSGSHTCSGCVDRSASMDSNGWVVGVKVVSGSSAICFVCALSPLRIDLNRF